MSPVRLAPVRLVTVPVTLLLSLGATWSQASDDTRLVAELLLGGFTNPIAATFVAPGELLIMQNTDGQVLRVVDGVPLNLALDLTICFQGGRGIVADPDVATNGYVYLFYGSSVADGGAWEESRVMRYTFDGTNLTAPFGPLFTVPFDAGQSNVDSYVSGYLRFGPDGMLYGQVGDKGRGRMGNPRLEQNTASTGSSLAGAIFRITPTGAIPVDNPFVAEANTALHPWYLYGFRNSLGLDFDPITDEMWFSDNSVGDYDEINRGAAGMNSGWLKIMGPDARDVIYPLNGNTAYDAVDLEYLTGSFYRDPEFSYKEAIGVTTITFLASKRFPEDLWNDLIVGDSNTGFLFHYELTSARDALELSGGLADKVADSATERDLNRFATGFGTVTDALIGPDGYLYVISWSNDAIYRLRPLVELYEPMSLTVVEGTLTGGGLVELERADDTRLALADAGRGGWVERRILESSTTLNASTATRLDVLVEARASSSRGVQTVELYHLPTSSWHTIDRRPLSRTDEVVLVEDVALPEEYVDASTRAVRVRVRHRSPARALALLAGSPPPASLVSEIDQVRVLATLP